MSPHDSSAFDAVTFTSSHKVEKGSGLQRAFSILLFAVFVIVDLLALVAGTSSYRSLNVMQRTNDSNIMTHVPIMSSVRANDVQDGVRKSADAPEGDALVLVTSDAEGTYETRIYLYEGKIMQEYALAGSPYTPEKATALADSSTFSFEYDGGILTIHTDAGVSKIALRNRQGGV